MDHITRVHKMIRLYPEHKRRENGDSDTSSSTDTPQRANKVTMNGYVMWFGFHQA
ncbi:hypothetical protein M413DRAFT_271072 [Hebeloma cylindrosporum]|uniref:Uncharacterized protein n=1 Tax=Hebeloma cylindrosporum TaxID=76867 RepID=A0A0C2Z1X7_HEBCY|nr:hypothetical protein M413DRAFT_271072 [Hebeloma cylindrosporum h7]